MMDRESWYDIKTKKPPEYEMCDLITKEGKVRRGWSTGAHYDGLKIKESDEIVKWRRVVFTNSIKD